MTISELNQISTPKRNEAGQKTRTLALNTNSKPTPVSAVLGNKVAVAHRNLWKSIRRFQGSGSPLKHRTMPTSGQPRPSALTLVVRTKGYIISLRVLAKTPE